MFKVRPSVRQKGSLTLAFETILSTLVTELSRTNQLFDYYNTTITVLSRQKKGILQILAPCKLTPPSLNVLSSHLGHRSISIVSKVDLVSV